MFKSKRDKKETGTSGGASSYYESNTVTKSNNGGSIMTRQISTETSHSRTYTRQESSYSMTHSHSAGNFPALSTTTNLALISPRSTFFNSPNTSSPSTTTTSSFVKRQSLLNSDATPFTSGLPNWHNSESFPMRSRQPLLPAIASQSAAQRRNMYTQSLPSIAPAVPTYEHKSLKLGKALILNNVKFAGEKEERQGAKKDSKDLKTLLKKMGFEVEHEMDLKAKEMSAKIKSFSKSDFSRFDISVVVIMSHGNNLVLEGNRVSQVRGGFTQIAGIDNVSLLTDDVIEMFTTGNCHKSLSGKPKIFIFQCCRGNKDQAVCHDAAPIRTRLKQHTDILIGFSTLPGFLSNRNPLTGTWYIQSICQVFEKNHEVHHVEDMLKMVDYELTNKHPQYTQTSTYENRGFKICFLHKNSR